MPQVKSRLDALLMVLKSCAKTSCTAPWKSLHPEGDVLSLSHALSPQYDDFYAAQANISYNYCDDGYIIAAEGPQDVLPFTAYHPQWSDLA